MMLSLSLILAFSAIAYSSPCAERYQPTAKDVIAQMFEWSWDSVAKECVHFLGPAGYGYVQVSPAQEHVQGSEWWTDYQPVSYRLTSKRGNRTQYENMIKTCHAAGVGVIADTLWNHMAGAGFGVGVDGSRFTHYDYPGIYQNQDFHHCGLQKDDNIVNYGNAMEVWTCQLSGLADLATDTEYVRQRLADYTNDLISLGVDGLRLDASKHMNPVDIANILSRLSTRPYITQEVIYGGGEAVTPDMYVGNGGVQEFRYTSALKNAFLRDGIQWLQDFDHRGWVPRSGANVFVSNHDTERYMTSLNAYSPWNTYTLASIFSLAHPYGVPTVLSSYSNFYHKDAGSPNGGTGNCSDTTQVNRWLCQHRWTAIAGMVGFRNNVNTKINPMTRWVAPLSQRIAFARGTAGFVAINNVDDPWSTSFSTGLPTGSYCNVIDGSASDGFCSGTVFWVGFDGSMSVTINPRQAIAIHAGARGVGVPIRKSAEQVSVLFYLTAISTPGEDIYVAGSVPQLGNWDTSNAIRLDPTNYPVWATTAYLPPNTPFEYKFFRKKFDGHIEWEKDPNRQDSTSASDMIWIRATWH